MSLLVYIEFPLIDHLIADINVAKGSMLSSVARISDARRKEFVSGIVDELKNLPIPNKIDGMSFFNPTTILGGLLPSKRYDFPTT
jgi:hypothetical protein